MDRGFGHTSGGALHFSFPRFLPVPKTDYEPFGANKNDENYEDRPLMFFFGGFLVLLLQMFFSDRRLLCWVPRLLPGTRRSGAGPEE